MRNTVVTAFGITVLALALLAFCFSVAGAAPPTNTRGHQGGFLTHILAQLKLTPAEQTAIDSILADQKATFQTLIHKLETDRATLKTDSTLSSYNESAVTTDAAAVGADLGNLIAARLDTEYLIYQALGTDGDTTRQEEFVKLLAVAKHGHHGFGH